MQLLGDREGKIKEFIEKWERYEKDGDICNLLSLTPDCTDEDLENAKKGIDRLLHPNINSIVSEDLKNKASEIWKSLYELLADGHNKKWLIVKFRSLVNQKTNTVFFKSNNHQEEIRKILGDIAAKINNYAEGGTFGKCIYYTNSRKNSEEITRFVKGKMLSWRYTPRTSLLKLCNDTYKAIYEYSLSESDAYSYDNNNFTRFIVIKKIEKLLKLYTDLEKIWYEYGYVIEKYLEQNKKIKSFIEAKKEICDILKKLKGRDLEQEYIKQLLEELKNLVGEKLLPFGDFIKDILVEACNKCNVFAIIKKKLLEKIKEIGVDEHEANEILDAQFNPNPYPTAEDMSSPEKVEEYIDKRVNDIWNNILLQRSKINIDNLYLINPFFLNNTSSNLSSSYFYFDSSTNQMYQVDDDGRVSVCQLSLDMLNQYIPLWQVLQCSMLTDKVIEELPMKYVAGFGYYIYEYDGKLLMKHSMPISNMQGNILCKEKIEKITAAITSQIASALSNYQEEQKRK